jgi:hypothetical protein
LVELYAVIDAGARGPCPEPSLLLRNAEGFEVEGADRVSLERHLTRCRACALADHRLRQARAWASSRVTRAVAASAGAAAATARTARTAPAAGRAALTAVLERLRSLLTFEMPVRQAMVTRAAVREARSGEYQGGLDAYAARRYAVAERKLLAARAAGERAPELHFYLGALEMRAGRPLEAAASFARVTRARPRIGEMHWHLAQARLAAGDAAGALRALRRAGSLAGPHRERARALAKELREALAGAE